MDLHVLIVCIQESDFLRVTFPRSRRALPLAKFAVATTSDDKDTLSMCAAFRVPTVQITKDMLTLHGATFNYGALATACVAYANATSQNNEKPWYLLTRANVVLDAQLASLELSSLTPGLYGCGFEQVMTTNELVTFVCKEPSPLEIRSLVPSSQFLLWTGNAVFPTWSKDCDDAIQGFQKLFPARYIVQLKLAHLGTFGEDVNGRKSPKWGEPRIRVEPVHAGTPNHPSAPPETSNHSSDPPESQKQEAPSSKQPVPAQFKTKFGFFEDDVPEGNSARSEVDKQQNVADNKEDSSEIKNVFKPQPKKW